MTARQKPESCRSCACESHGTDFSAIEGTGANGVMIVAEASGEMEARDQLPLRPYAPAGSLLERSFRRMGMDRQEFSLTNVLRCRPRNNWLEGAPWEHSAIAACRPNLDAAIRSRRPRAIVALGGTALRELTGMAGEQRGISHLAGYVLRGPDDIPVIADFHPAFLRRGKASHQGLFARILRRATEIAAGRDREWMWNIDPEDENVRIRLNYAIHPTESAACEFRDRILGNPSLVVAYDLETYESASLDEDAREGFADTELRLVQFSAAGLGSMALPWSGGFRHIVQSILQSPNPKCGHNVWLFDNKVLRAAGLREAIDLNPRGVIHDTLQMFHHWQPDLPAHLQFCSQFVSFPFPWKHLAGSDIQFYGCCDVDATLRLYTFLESALRKDGIWGDDTTGYLGQVYNVRPVLAGMEDRGMPIDDDARLALDGEFKTAQEKLGREIAAAAPDACKRITPKNGYVGRGGQYPPEVKVWIAENYTSAFDYGLEGIQARVPAVRFQDGEDGEFYHYEQREFNVPDDDLKLVPTLRWCRVYDFNPNSKDQVIAYMKSKGHKIPKSKEEDDEGNQKDTTNEKELRRLAVRTGDSFYLKVVEYRGFTKLRSTYIDGFVPQDDGCVHTTFTFAPAIGQLSSRNPNIQNFTKLKPTVELAKAMRRMVAAKEGNILTEWDFKSCHIQTLGFLAEDEQYCVTPDTRLLTSNLRWKRAEDVRIGDVLIGFGKSDRMRAGRPIKREALTPTVVDSTSRILRPCVTVLTDRSAVSCSTEHMWFARPKGNSHYRWVRADALKPGMQIAYFVRPWEVDNTRDGGWLSGIFDGEGCVHTRGGVTVAQKEGLVLEEIERLLAQRGFQTSRWNNHNCISLHIVGEQFSWLRVLGMLRPVRLMARAGRGWIGMVPFSKRTIPATVLKVDPIGDKEVCAIATTTGNFIAEGYLSHNCRLGRLDMHSFVAGHFLKLWDGAKIINESDDELRARFKWLKSDPDRKRVRDDQAKHGILGIGNGLRAKGLYERYLESFPPTACSSCSGSGREQGVRGTRNCRACAGSGTQSGQRTAEAVLEVAEALFPKVFAYQERQRKEAHERQHLSTPFGYMRRFYEVYRWDGKRGSWGHGDQAEEAVAYRLANIAFGHIREKLKELHREGLDERYGLFNNVHDSFMFHFPETELERHIREVYPVLVRPSTVLRHPTICPDGLVIDVDGAYGKNWAEMTAIDVNSRTNTKELSHAIEPSPVR